MGGSSTKQQVRAGVESRQEIPDRERMLLTTLWTMALVNTSGCITK